MARRAVQLLPVSDFTGGLNLRDDSIQLAPNELADTENVRVNAQGGVERRQAVQRLNSSALSATPGNVWAYYKSAATRQIVVQRGQTIAYATTAGTFTDLGTGAPLNVAVTGTMRAAVMARITGASLNIPMLYVQRNGEQAAFRFDGSAATALTDPAVGPTWNDNLAAPAGAKMPPAKYITWHQYAMWVASTVENSVAYPNRVRWSHPGQPEDWRTNDYIDVGVGTDGDQIMGIVAMDDSLFVFKRRSIWSIFGPGKVVRPLATGTGAVSQEAIAAGRQGVAWFDPVAGVMLFDGKNVRHLWPKLSAKIADGTIQQAYLSKVTVQWLDDRLFVSVPWDANATTNNRTFVWDAQCGKDGAWYTYEYGVGPMAEYAASDETPLHLACSPTTSYVWKLESGTTTDNFGGGAAGFNSSFKTAWFDAGMSGVRKRWRRPTFLVDNEIVTTFVVRVFTDFKPANATRQMSFTTDPTDTGMDWGDNWGGNWSADASGEQAIERGTGLGRAYAVQLHVLGPQSSHWHLNQAELRFIPQRIR